MGSDNPRGVIDYVRVVVPEFLTDRHLEMLRSRVSVTYDPDLYADRARLLGALAGARAIVIRNRTMIDSTLLAAANDLLVVGRLGVGLDNIDMQAAEEAGVRVIPAYGANSVSVAEYVLGAMLVLQRNVYSMTESMAAGEWPRQGRAFGRELFGKTLGLIGYGSIARLVGDRAAAFGMRIVAFDPLLPQQDPAWTKAERIDLDVLLAESDVVSIHVPLTDDTKLLMNHDAIHKMRPGALLVNTSRGGIVDETALVQALRSGHLGGAAMDVFANEPLGHHRASIFVGIERLLLTPHLAGNTEESVDRVATMIVEAVLEVLET